MEFSQFDVQDSIELLRDDYFQEIIERRDYQLLVSVFKEMYNLVLPKKSVETIIELSADKDLVEWQQKGYEFSYYLDESQSKDAKEWIEKQKLELLYNDLYIYKRISEKYLLEKKNIITINNNSLKDFIHAGEICFPDWNNEDFTVWCLKSSHVELFGIVEENQIIAFGGYFAKPDHDYVLLINFGTIPSHRRRGLFEYLVKYSINKVLDEKKNAVFYANVMPGEQSYHGFKKMGFLDGPVFKVLKIN